jgi:Bacterial Ig domain/HYR domain/Lectin C-type domain/Secretion system C-terminal sorting domain
MKRNTYILIAMLLVWLNPLSMQAFGTTPTSTTEKTLVAGCDAVTVVGGSGSIALGGLGSYSHIIVFTPGFASIVYDNSAISTATLNIPITTAGDYIVKVWSNPDPAAPCENNFNVTVTAAGTGGGCSNVTSGGTISKACSNGVTTLSGTAPVGGTGALEYQWLSAVGACPTSTTQAVAGGTNATLTVSNASVTATTYYVRCVRRAGCSATANSWVPGESNCISVGVNECPTTTTGGGSNICTSTAANIVGGAGSIAITGITTSCAMVQVFNSSWTSVYNQQTSTTSVTVPNLTAGSYIVKVTVLGTGCSWPSQCEVMQTVTVTGGGGTGGTPPVAVADNATTASGTAVSIAVLGNDNLAGAALQSLVIASNPANGTAVVSGNNIVYTPRAGFTGTDQFTYTITTANGTSTTTVSVTVTGGGTTGGGTCTEYNVANANDCAGGTWQPYGTYIAGVFYQIKDGKFRKNSDGTATLTANYTTDGWSIAGTANVTFTGMTMTAPVGSPKYSTCTQGASTADWMYYTAFSGTLTIGGVSQTIARRGEAFQVGTGANWQNRGDLGGSGWFTLGNGTLGDFNFRLSGGTSCGGVVDPCLTDAIAPTFQNCPANIALTTSGACANASWTAPTATDNCGTPTVTQLLGGTNGSCFTVGTTMVKYMAADAKGNVSTCIFNVVVTKIVVDPCATDVTAPVLSGCPANIVKTPTAAGACWTVSWTAPTATDNCSTATVTQSAGPSNGSCVTPGTYTVTYKATDAKGNASTCSFTVTVNAYLNCAVVTGNTIAKSCVNNVPSLTGAALTGYEYQWLSATSGCPTLTSQAIAGATGQHYTLASRVATTTYFVRCARPIGCTTWGTVNESNCVTVTATDCAPAVCNAPATPNGWMYLGVFGTSHYFKWTGSGDITNADARVKAASIGGRLPVIKTTEQNSFLQSKLAGGSAWIGLRRSGSTWLLDNNAVATYYNWNVGEPNNSGGVEHCVQMLAHGAWNDQNCAGYNWCIAEIPCAGVNSYLVLNDQISINASAEVNRTRLEWTNNTGYKNDFFTVEKVNPATGDFEKLDVINNKYSTDINEFYSVYDNAPTEGDNTYRVKVTYVDGTSATSATQTLNFKGAEGIRLYPNPAVDVVGVDLSKYKGQAVTIALYNQFGQQVLTQQIEKATGTFNLDVSNNTVGNYLIRVVSKGRKDVIQQLHIAK